MVVSVVYSLVDNIKSTTRLKKVLGLDEVDEFIDHTLERFSSWIDLNPFAWLTGPVEILGTNGG